MKIILMQDVKSLGKKGEVVSVNDGYARNYILPKKLGLEATSANLNTLKLKKANEARLEEESYQEALALKERIEKMEITLPVKVGENGKLFGSISAKEVATAVTDIYKVEIDKKKLVLPDSIKSIGSYECRLKVHPKVSAVLKLKIVSE